MYLSLIVAADENNGIGINGDQPAFISADLKRFKALTTGNTIVMGRKTFEALPKGALPNRRNIVLSHQEKYSPTGCEVIKTPDDLQRICTDKEQVFVIGGGEVYQLFLPAADRIYLTLIHCRFEGVDTWFPGIDANIWKLESREGPFTDEKSGYSYSYQTYYRP